MPSPEHGPLAAAGSGWHARLELGFARRGAATRLVHNRHHGPLRLIRALDDGCGRCEAVIVHPPGGLVAGDRLELELELASGAQVLATTPGAQKWYRGEPASLAATRLRVGSGASLEWLPQPSIVFDRAHVEQMLEIELAADASCIGWEMLVLGRAAMPERFLHGRLRQSLSIAVAGRPLWVETFACDADDRLLSSPLGWGGRTVAASVWAVGDVDDALLSAWREALASSGCDGGATRPDDRLLVAKLLADDAQRAVQAARRLWETARPRIARAPAIAPRLWAT